MVRRVLRLAAILLGAFHVWLLLSQAWAGDLVDAALVSRWLVAVGLSIAMVVLRRRGLPLLRGRHAIAVWLLAALLHGPALARDVEGVAPSMPEVVATLAQAVTTLAVVGTLLLVLFAFRFRRSAVALLAAAHLQAPAFVGALPPRSFLRFSARPPPLGK
ncbi:MAG: hypothetical protein ABIP90_12510 [Vicinamibacterales bacterium]